MSSSFNVRRLDPRKSTKLSIFSMLVNWRAEANKTAKTNKTSGSHKVKIKKTRKGKSNYMEPLFIDKECSDSFLVVSSEALA